MDRRRKWERARRDDLAGCGRRRSRSGREGIMSRRTILDIAHSIELSIPQVPAHVSLRFIFAHQGTDVGWTRMWGKEGQTFGGGGPVGGAYGSDIVGNT